MEEQRENRACEEIQKAIEKLQPEMISLVKSIESRIAITQNHYGDYMVIIQELAGNNKNLKCLISIALVRAGANKKGIQSALKLCL